jgi:GNAT superfamily N-acetyltransferase
MSVRIRPLESKDRPHWERLFRGYIEFYETSVPDDVIESTWQRLIDRMPGFHEALVAVNEADEPVGLAHILLHRSTWTAGFYCYLEDLFVDPAQRVRGIGRALNQPPVHPADHPAAPGGLASGVTRHDRLTLG